MARRAPGSLPPLLPAFAFAGFTIAAIALSARIPRPDASTAEFYAYVADHRDLLRLSGLLFVPAALQLGVWTATVHHRVRILADDPPGATIALVGGILAAVTGMLTGLLGWAISRAPEPSAAAALRDLQFAMGAPGFIVSLALLIGGVSISLLLSGHSRALALSGLVVAAIEGLSLLSLFTLDLAVILPIGRFTGMLWILAASVVLTRVTPPRKPVAVAV
ncbi:hypothetical protein [Nocardia jejuensis]|uniref:hypothetical protein n=1 Tax=Nocardia jejuensis TaxID=328049 RepID=UPI00083121F6|nr:hypothetical protein [Nocardia jejuensis]